MTLSVLHISTNDNLGGSARSAYKIHSGLRARGAVSRMLVRTKSTDDPDVDQISKGAVRIADKVSGKVSDRLSLQYLFYPSSYALLRHPWFREADVVQLYNTHGGYFSHSVLPLLSRRKPVVWRLSDAWPVTGHCAYPGACEGWRTGCKSCPDLAGYPSLRRDTASVLWSWKKRVYADSRIHVVAPSSWTLSLAEESPLFAGFRKSLIPNGVDTDIFKPMDRAACRRSLGIPDGKRVLFFAANVLPRNPRKGSEYFVAAANQLHEEGMDVLALAAGEGAAEWGSDLRCPVMKRDLITGDAEMAAHYNAADVFVHPAVLENMPNAIVEATACGVPSAAFDAGGTRDALRHRETGYLARFKDAEDLAGGIRWILSGDPATFREACRSYAMERFSLESQARGFLELYESLTEEKASR